jgi:hypothetical protein
MDPEDWDDSIALAERKRELVGSEPAAVFLDGEWIELVLWRARAWDIFEIQVVHDGARLEKVLIMPVVRAPKVAGIWSTLGMTAGKMEAAM